MTYIIKDAKATAQEHIVRLQEEGKSIQEMNAFFKEQNNGAVEEVFKAFTLEMMMNPGVSVSLYYAIRKDFEEINEVLTENGLETFTDFSILGELAGTLLAEDKTLDDLFEEIDSLGGLEGLNKKETESGAIDLNAINGDPEDRDADAEYGETKNMFAEHFGENGIH